MNAGFIPAARLGTARSVDWLAPGIVLGARLLLPPPQVPQVAVHRLIAWENPQLLVHRKEEK